jgi:hypothetical protein
LCNIEIEALVSNINANNVEFSFTHTHTHTHSLASKIIILMPLTLMGYSVHSIEYTKFRNTQKLENGSFKTAPRLCQTEIFL